MEPVKTYYDYSAKLTKHLMTPNSITVPID